MKFYRFINTWLIILAALGGAYTDIRNCKDCGGVFTARQTIITSPKYPENYPSRVCCDYMVRSPHLCPTNYHIQFLDFSLEPSLNCVNDFLAIGDMGVPDIDVRNYTSDILCGRVTGIGEYRSQDGILRVRFMTNEAIEDRGFRLLITRLSCEETKAGNITDDKVLLHREKDIPKSVVTIPNLELRPPFHTVSAVSDLTKQTNNHQGDVFRSEQYLPSAPGYLPNNPSYPFHPQSSTPLTPTNNGYLPPGNPCPTPSWIPENNYYPQNNNYPQQLPAGSCCVGNIQHQRLYLTSPGFPARTDASPLRDCFYHIERSGPNVCRLRVVFRFFALGSADAYSTQCLSDFIEIDGERMCGCRTGFVYTSDWSLGMKVICLKTYGRISGTASIGFLLDVIQEDCGVRYSRQVGVNNKPRQLIPHAVVETNSTTTTKFYLHNDNVEQLGHSFNDGVNSKLFFGQTNPCEFGFLDLLSISFDPLWLTRPKC